MSTTFTVPVFNGEKFRQARLRAGVSLRDPRWRFKSPNTRLSKWQRGVQEPKLETVRHFAEVLSCSVSEFYDFVEVGGDDE